MDQPRRRVIRIEDRGEDHPRFEHNQTVRTDGTETIYHCSVITGRNNRNEASVPGWIPCEKTPYKTISKPSLITPYIKAISAYHNPRKEEWIDGLVPAAHRDIVRSILRPSKTYSRTHPQFSSLPSDQEWMKRLRPPSLRHREKPHLIEVFNILFASGWRSPEYSTILESPTWHPRLGNQRFLVVSNTLFNQTYFYPEIIAVPITAWIDSATEAETDELGLITVDVKPRDEKVVVWPELVQTISFSLDWLGECYGCCDPDAHRPERWLIEGGERAGHCLQCDGSDVQSDIWPVRAGHVSADDMARVEEAVVARLKLGES